MSRLLFKDTEYTYGELLELYLKNKKHYQEGEIIDLETGEIYNIKNIKENLSKPYINEIMNKKDVNYKLKTLNNSILEEKYKNKTITKDEMYKYLIALNQHTLTPNYNYDKGYIIVNLNKIPLNITDAEYGKFHKMLSYLSTNHLNRISHKNQHPVSKLDLCNFLAYKKIEYFNKYLRKLKKYRLVEEQNYGETKYLIINPAYAKRSMELDRTIYLMFKEDLDECLTDEQKFYLNMENEDVGISYMIPMSD